MHIRNYKFGCFTGAIILIFNICVIPKGAAEDNELIKYIEKANQSFALKEWKMAARFYNKYLYGAKENDSLYINSLYSLADIYYEYLKRYTPSLDIYRILDKKISDTIIKDKIASLIADIDDDGFTYAQEHDLGISDNIPILSEIDKIVPQECSIVYIKKGGFQGGILKYLKFSKNIDKIYVSNNKEEIIGELEINSFLKIWVSLGLIEPEDIPEDNVIWYDEKEMITADFPSSIVMDATYADIIVISEGRTKKIFTIYPIELASNRLHNLIQELDKIYLNYSNHYVIIDNLAN